MIASDNVLRAKELEAYEAIELDRHSEIVRLILAEVSLLTDKYRYVRRHDVPHIRELVGLVDLLWQDVEMHAARPREPALHEEIGTY